MNTIDRNDIIQNITDYLAASGENLKDYDIDAVADALKAYADANDIVNADDINEDVFADTLFSHMF